MLTINDIEKYAVDVSLSSIKRNNQQNQGVYVCLIDDKLLGYCVFVKEFDEENTVRIKEICILKDSRKHGIGKQFIKHLYDHVFTACKFKKIVFTFSIFNQETHAYCVKHDLSQIDCWPIFYFLPGVVDKRIAYSVEF